MSQSAEQSGENIINHAHAMIWMKAGLASLNVLCRHSFEGTVVKSGESQSG